MAASLNVTPTDRHAFSMKTRIVRPTPSSRERWPTFCRGIVKHAAGRAEEAAIALYVVEEMRRINVPTLIITGDEDWPCFLPAIL